jgi:hypothetical protein
MASDISANELDEGDLVRALQAIRARMLLMLGRTDLYFSRSRITPLRCLISRKLSCDRFHRSGDMWLVRRRPVTRIFPS